MQTCSTIRRVCSTMFKYYIMFILMILPFIFASAMNDSTVNRIEKREAGSKLYFNICYSINTDVWGYASDTPQNLSISLVNRKKQGHSKVHGNCDTPLTLQNVGTGASYHVRGTFFYLCSWVNHFGHILVDMLFPSIYSIRLHGFDHQGMQVVVDNRFYFPWGSNQTVLNTFQSVFPKHEVLDFQKIVTSAKRSNMNLICFDRLMIGLEKFDLIYHERLPPSPNLLSGLRNAILRDMEFNNLPLTDKSHVLTIENRLSVGRHMINIDQITAVAKELFNTNWDILNISLEKYNFTDQVYIISRSSIFISVAGTGSHMSLFLPDDAENIIVTSSINPNVNKKICDNFSSIRCHTIASTCGHNQSLCERNADVTVNLIEFKNLLLNIKSNMGI